MINYSFSIYDLEFFLLILVRVTCFVYVAPFFSMRNTPANVRIAMSFFTSLLLYQALTPTEAVTYSTLTGYTVIVLKEHRNKLSIGT